MRVLHVIDVLTLGGAQGLALRVMEGLEERGVEDSLCVLMGEGRTHALWELPERPVYLGFDGDYRNPVTWRRCCRALGQVVGDVRPDVVLSTNWLADVTAARACCAAGVGHVAYLVDRRGWLESGAWKHRYRRRLTRRAFESAGTRFMAVSGAVADYVSDHLPVERERIEVVRNAIDVGRFAGERGEVRGQRSERGDRSVVGMLARLEEEKGHGVLLEAVSSVVGKGHSVSVRIAGEGPLRGELEEQVRRAGLEEEVSFEGCIHDAGAFYRECDIFAVPSISSEGLPTTILEAMASGCVVVASDVGGAREVIDDGLNGVIVAPRNPDALGRALKELIEDAGRRSEYQVRAREKAVREFDVKQMIDRVQEILERVAAREASPVKPVEVGA